MSKRYPGNFITGNPVALSQTSNNGIFDLKDNYIATGNNTWQEADGVYEIPKSLRFKRSSTAYFNRTFGTPTNSKAFTYSGWIKISPVNGYSYCLMSGCTADENNEFWICWTSNTIICQQTNNGSGSAYARTNTLCRDSSAWYHVVVAVDASHPTGANRLKIYINGVQQYLDAYSGLWATTQNFTPWINYSGNLWRIGQLASPNNGAMDGYMAEVNFIDGQQLDPSYFGYFDPVTKIWQPKKYTGTYGNNGVYLPFTQTGHTTQLGKNYAVGSNYITYSEQLDNGNWAKPAAPVAPTVSANSTTAPDGSSTADTINYSGSSTHPVYQAYSASIPPGQSWIASWYVKQSVGTTFALQCTIFGAGTPLQDGYNFFTFDSANKITSSASNGYMTNVGSQYIGNGWHRVWACNTNQTASTGDSIRISLGQNGASSAWSIYAWGAQLDFGDTLLSYTPTTSSTIGFDWTPNNFSLTAGSTYDSMVDSPTNIPTSATDIGGVVVGNYATFNSLSTNSAYNVNTTALSQAGLVTSSSTANTISISTVGIPNQPYGKYYCEIVMTANSGGSPLIGLGTAFYQSLSGYSYWPQSAYRTNGSHDWNGGGAGSVSGLTTWSTNDVIGIAVDMTTNGGQVTYYKNNSAIYTKTGLIANWSIYDIHICCQTNSTSTGTFVANFGQRPFTYAPPAGHKGICTTNIQQFMPLNPAAVQPFKYFDAVGHMGNATSNSSANSINIVTTPGGFAPDLVWTKGRYGPVSSSNHLIEDSARGPRRPLVPHSTDAALTDRGIQAFLSNGFQFNNSDGGDGNYVGQQYINWMWKESPNAGLDIITYTGNGTAGRTISHNLGVAPTFIIWKSTSATGNWYVWSKAMDLRYQATGWLYLNNTYPRQTSATTNEYPTYKVDPTSSNITLNGSGSSNGTNNNGETYVMYAFADTPGFCKTGIWESSGNTDGPFVYTGFKPKFIMFKSLYQNGTEWIMKDTTRELYNNADNAYNLTACKVSLENDGTYLGGPTGANNIDWLSNGFKIRYNNGNMNYNYSGSAGDPYLFIAFADQPFYLNNRAR